MILRKQSSVKCPSSETQGRSNTKPPNAMVIILTSKFVPDGPVQK